MKNKTFFLWITIFTTSCLMIPWLLNASEKGSADEFYFQTKLQGKYIDHKNLGEAWLVDKNNFPALDGVTCYTLEIWDESMRLPHWHPNASELGYLVSGTLEVIIWRSLGETAVFTVGEGMCWFIPQGALHSLNNIGEGTAQLLVGFASEMPQNIDLPVAYNGIPLPVRESMTSPHEELKNWKGPILSPLFGGYTPDRALSNLLTGSPYKFDLSKVTPLFNHPQVGSVAWGVKDNWNVLENISVLHARLKRNVARDPIWYPDANMLYVVAHGSGQFHIVIDGMAPQSLSVSQGDYVFVPVGILHTFLNNSPEDLEVIAFFNKANPLPEVSLSVATSFFPNSIKRLAMTQYAGVRNSGEPLQYLKYTNIKPYLIPLHLPAK